MSRYHYYSRAIVQALEARLVLAAEPGITLDDNGQLLIIGTEGDDTTFTVNDPDDFSRIIVTLNGQEYRYLKSDISTFRIEGRGGNDELAGFFGDSILACSIYGGNGNDRIRDATYQVGGPGNDTLGGSGVVDYSDQTTPILFDAGLRDAESIVPTVTVSPTETDTLGDGCTIRGTAFDDVFDVFWPNSFVWHIEGMGGDDRIIAGPDLTTFDAGDGRDTLDFGNAVINVISASNNIEVVENIGVNRPQSLRDDSGRGLLFICSAFYQGDGEQSVTIWAGGGDDTVIGSPGRDSLMGEDGNDRIYGGGENDTIRGGNGRDILVGGGGADRLHGDGGNDLLVGEGGNDTLNGNSGNDNLHGGSGDDRLFGGSGNDTIDGGGGRDLLDGQAGNDLLYARDGLRDTLFGGSGLDRARRDNSFIARDIVDGIEAFS
ncbi:MAG TPA: calcium-binding protein [Tepidisphaeraceae bacterium]|nr:calcium-binding protein [Tepidisphaeraceae bacterium]